MKNISLIACCSFLFLLTSCASYVQTLHSQIDRDNRAQRAQALRASGQADPRLADPRLSNPRAAMRNPYSREGDRRPIANPKTLGGYPTTATQRNARPQVEREYGTGRVRAEDLRDNSPDGSLWSGKSSQSFLFVTNNIKKQGDIVIIEVLSRMKSDITEELGRAFPDRPAKKSDDKDKESDKKEDEAKPQEVAAQGSDDGKIYDKISTQVMESVNQDYLLVRGRKEVVFKKAKRYIEIQALVSRRDISDNDTVKSDRVLEPKIRALRY